MVIQCDIPAWWSEYLSAARWCAARNVKGRPGDRLPQNMSKEALAAINDDPETFEEEVKLCAYEREMAAVNAKYPE